jgi:hypothetical protein
MRAIKTAYPEDTSPKIRNAWTDWYDNISPHSGEDVDTYVARILDSDFACEVKSPMARYFRDSVVNSDITWSVDHNLNDVFNPKFEWLNNLKAAMNSVKSRFNMNPLQPRLSELGNAVVVQRMFDFASNTSQFVNSMKAKTNVILKKMVSSHVLYDGVEIAVSQLKKDELIEKLQLWSSSFCTEIFRPFNSVTEALLKSIMIQSNVDDHDILVTVTDESLSVPISKLAFRSAMDPQSVLSPEILKAFLALFSKRDKRVCEAHEDVKSRKTRTAFVKRKSCRFFGISFLTTVGDVDNDEACKSLLSEPIDMLKRLYMLAIKDDHLVIFFIDTEDEKNHYLDPRLDRDAVPAETRAFIDTTKGKLVRFANL